MNILVAGKTSFLFKSLLASGMFDSDNLYEYEYNVEYTNIDRIYYFGSMTVVEEFETFEDAASTGIMMIDYPVKIMEQAIANNAEIVLVSSECVDNVCNIDSECLDDSDRYNLFKLTTEEYLKSFSPTVKTCVLRSPRVYDISDHSGFVGELLSDKVPHENLDDSIIFITVNEFIEFFEECLEIFTSSKKNITFKYAGTYFNCMIGDVINNLQVYEDNK